MADVHEEARIALNETGARLARVAALLRALTRETEEAPPDTANRLDPLIELATREVEEIKTLNGDAQVAVATLRREAA